MNLYFHNNVLYHVEIESSSLIFNINIINNIYDTETKNLSLSESQSIVIASCNRCKRLIKYVNKILKSILSYFI